MMQRKVPIRRTYTRAHCHLSLLFAPLLGIVHINENEGGRMTEGPRPDPQDLSEAEQLPPRDAQQPA
jgi:hypothetical protein